MAGGFQYSPPSSSSSSPSQLTSYNNNNYNNNEAFAEMDYENIGEETTAFNQVYITFHIQLLLLPFLKIVYSTFLFSVFISLLKQSTSPFSEKETREERAVISTKDATVDRAYNNQVF